MTNPCSSKLIEVFGVELEPDLQLVLESDRWLEPVLGIENEMLGGRPIEPETDPN